MHKQQILIVGIAYVMWHIMWLVQSKFLIPYCSYFPSVLFLLCSAADISYTLFHAI